MKALILRNDADASLATAQALIDKGFQILSVDTQTVAHALIRVDTVDLLVMDEQVGGQLTHAIALSGERRNPYLSAIFVTDRTSEDTNDLYELIPSLYALVGGDTTPELLGLLAQSAVTNVEEAKARAAENVAAVMAESHKVSETVTQQPSENVRDDILILAQSDLTSADEEPEDGAPSYADVAIAKPALAEIAEVEQSVTLDSVEEAVIAEVSALFRKHPLPQFLQSYPSLPAKAS